MSEESGIKEEVEQRLGGGYIEEVAGEVIGVEANLGLGLGGEGRVELSEELTPHATVARLGAYGRIPLRRRKVLRSGLVERAGQPSKNSREKRRSREGASSLAL